MSGADTRCPRSLYIWCLFFAKRSSDIYQDLHEAIPYSKLKPMEENKHKKKEEELQVFKEEPTSVGNRRRKDYFLPASIILAGVLIAGAIVFAMTYKGGSSSGGSAAQQQTATSTADVMKLGSRDVVLGDANAPVTIIEYGDYQCPWCNTFFVETQPLIVKNYIDTGKVKMVFRNFIVNDRTSGQHESHNSALAAECAKDQNKFWDFHDALSQLEFNDETASPQTAENNGNLNRDAFMNIAKTLGMDQSKFASCFDSGQYSSEVQQESDQAMKYGLSATPTFFINGQQVTGALPYVQFQAGIDSLLKG